MNHGVSKFWTITHFKLKQIVFLFYFILFTLLFCSVPTQKMPRLLTTSASACRRLLTKAELMGVDVAALEFQEAQVENLCNFDNSYIHLY